MARPSPRVAAARLRAWAAGGGLDNVLRGILRMADTRIGARAVGTYMRDAKGEGRRLKTDAGPLRIVTARHARAVSVPRAPGHIARIEAQGARVTLLKGVDLALDPGGWNEVREDREKYRTIGPAWRDEREATQSLASKRVAAAFARAIRTGTA